MHDVLLDSRNVKTLATSAIEVYNRETTGLISAKNVTKTIKGRKKNFVTLNTVYPIQTAERKPSKVLHGNILAYKRAVKTLSAMNTSISGGFHSHTNYYPNYNVYPELSKEDVEFIEDEMKHLKAHGHQISSWLEILISIKERKYSSSHKIGTTTKAFKKKLGIRVTTNPYTAYDITLSGYWLQNGTEKLRVVKEPKIFLK